MRAQIVFAGLAFFIFVTIGGYFAVTSWNGVVYVSLDKYSPGRREPAAVQKGIDFSYLEAGALQMRSQKRMADSARVFAVGDDVGIELGQFITRDENNERLLSCDFYDHVSIQFIADGEATNGEPTVFRVDGPCTKGEDLSRMAALVIPVSRILNEKPAEMDLTYDTAVSMHFENSAGHWPKNWIMQSIRLYSESHPTRELLVGPTQLREARDQVLRMEWPTKRQ